MIAVIDYGMGNLRSVHKAFERLGFDVRVTGSARLVDDADGVVLPGVGAFRDCMENLDREKLVEPILRAVSSGKPFLGICLGLQVLFAESEEFGRADGLGVFAGRVVRFSDEMDDPDAKGAKLKVPHMGWNQLDRKKDHPVLENLENGDHFYFVHSYHVVPEDKSIIATTTDYGIEFVSSVARDNLFACQFHPEKSQRRGLALLKNFGELVNRELKP